MGSGSTGGSEPDPLSVATGSSDPITQTLGAVPQKRNSDGIRFDMGVGSLTGFRAVAELWSEVGPISLAGIDAYPGTQGELEYLEAMTAMIEAERGVALDCERIVATHGALDGVAHALASLPRGSSVFYPMPGFDVSGPIIRAGHEPCPLRWGPAEPVAILLERLETALSSVKHAVGVVVNVPANPGGQVPLPEEWLALIALVERSSGILVVDDVYGFLVDHPTALYQHDRVVLVESFSKRFGAPGLRLGAAICPCSLVGDVRGSIARSTVGVARPIARVGAAAIKRYLSHGVRGSVIAELGRRRAEFSGALDDDLHLLPKTGQPTLYVTLELPPTADPVQATSSLLASGLAATSGFALDNTATSDDGHARFLRFCLGGTADTVGAAAVVNGCLGSRQEAETG
jgi:aspartate/methionine/tyrosine aminotransferase